MKLIRILIDIGKMTIDEIKENSLLKEGMIKIFNEIICFSKEQKYFL